MGRLRVVFAFILLSLIWGSSYLFIRLGLRQLTPVSLVALRLLFGALGIYLIVLVRRERLAIPRELLPRAILIGTINTTIPFLLISWGETHITSGLASVLNSTTPIFAVLVAGILLHDEPVTVSRLGGVLVGIVGVVVLASGDFGATVSWVGLAGQGAVVLAAICYAFGPVLVRRWMRSVSATTLTTYTLTAAMIETVVISALFSRPPLPPDPLSWFSTAWLGLLGSALGYVLYYFIIQSWGAARGTLVTYMLPVVGLALGAGILGESLGWRVLGGSALVILGVVLASLVRRSRSGVPPEPMPAASDIA
ncbi:MAG TPA: DMT family transporter [Chloroflexota bacterium]|nr:DMT family transporter [Chloroflexota bacterium]